MTSDVLSVSMIDPWRGLCIHINCPSRCYRKSNLTSFDGITSFICIWLKNLNSAFLYARIWRIDSMGLLSIPWCSSFTSLMLNNYSISALVKFIDVIKSAQVNNIVSLFYNIVLGFITTISNQVPKLVNNIFVLFIIRLLVTLSIYLNFYYGSC